MTATMGTPADDDLLVAPEAAVEVVEPRRRRRLHREALVAFAVLGVLFAVGLLANVLPLQDPDAQDLGAILEAPSTAHWLGTDDVGRDMLARTIFGLRTTSLAALTALLVTVAIGIPAGLLGGYRRGKLDAVLSRVADAMMAVPPLVLLFAVIAALGTGLTKTMIVLGVILAPRMFRVVRASTISLTGQAYLEVGRLSGCSHSRMLRRYVLPNVRAQVIVQVSFLLGLCLLMEAGISFLGLGVQPPDSSLGSMLATGADFIETAPWVVLVPGLTITILTVAANVAGDSLAREKHDA